MSGFLKEMREALEREIGRFRHRPFLEAAMAASALMAAADGVVRLSEQSTLDEALETVRALKLYDPHRAVDLYRDYVNELRERPATGRERALRALRRIAHDPQAARIVLKIGCAIGAADGEVGAAERTVLAEICTALSLPPAEAGL